MHEIPLSSSFNKEMFKEETKTPEVIPWVAPLTTQNRGLEELTHLKQEAPSLCCCVSSCFGFPHEALSTASRCFIRCLRHVTPSRM